MAGKSKDVEQGYIDKLAEKASISFALASKLKLISDSRYSNLMKTSSGPDQRDVTL